jgi:mycobactin peptide synthetase MbtE
MEQAMNHSGYPRDATIHDLVTGQAIAAPDAPAVLWPSGTLTYRQLACRSARLARRIVAHGIQRGELVAVRAERSTEWIIANLAVLRAGAAYLPISPAEPDRRVDQLLDDARVRLLLGDTEGELPGGRGTEFSIAADTDASAELPDDVSATDRAYVMYTSGSTGRPKGVVVCHRNVVRLVRGTGFVSFSAAMRVLPTGAVSFDATTFELWGPLANGGALYLADEDVILDAIRLGAVLRRHEITTMWLTSPLFSRLVQQDPAIFAPLTDLVVGGDVVVGKHVAAVLAAAPGVRVVNGYGPTENTTFSTTHAISLADTDGPVPIGRPISNSTAYVLDQAGIPVAPGSPGHLYVGGDGVALGYLNQPELTDAAFMADPFLPGGRMYRTGDLARQSADGVIEFLGREDGQVKIRGYRVEPGEIEAVMCGHPAVSDVTVVLRTRRGGDPFDRYLAAYLTTAEPLEVRELRAYLAERLPRHLVPGYLVVLDDLPLTAHGKIDRSALPDPEGLHDIAVEYVPPRNVAEEQLVAIWERLLPGAPVGVLNSIFDHGVDSLTVASLAVAITEASGKRISIADIFRNPTVADLAELLALRAPEPGQANGLTALPAAERYPLSPQQYSLYVEQRKDSSSVRYNVPVLLEIPANTDPARLEQAWRGLARRHEILRTSFGWADEPVQVVHAEVEPSLELVQGEPRLQELIRPFDLAVAPLARASLHRSGEHRWLFVDMHHLVTDGFSLALLFTELDALYRGRELPPVPHPYRDYALWAAEGEGRRLAEEQRDYWTKVFAGWSAQAGLPTDRPRPQLRTNAGDLLILEINAGRTAALRALAANRSTTLFAVLAAVYAAFLAAVTGHDDLAVGVPASGRTVAGLDETAGMFVNTVCLRLRPAAHKRFADLVDEVSVAAREAFARQDFPFGELVRAVAGERVPGRNPLFDTMLALQPGARLETDFLGERVELRPCHTGQAMFDLNLQVYEGTRTLYAEWEYSTELFDRATVATFRDVLLGVLDRALADPKAPVADLTKPVNPAGRTSKETVPPSRPVIEFNF